MRNQPEVTQSYSSALFNIAKKESLIPILFDEANSLLKVLRQSKRLIFFLEGPHIEDSDKHKLIDDVFKGNINPLLINLMHLLIDYHRAEYLCDIIEDYCEKVQLYRNIYPATVITANEINFLDKLKLKSALEKYTKKQLNITYIVKKNLIGGIIFKFGDMHIDFSLRDGLNEIRQKLEAITLS